MPNHKPVSESEEMYLITIAQIQEETGDQPIPLTQVSTKLAIQPVSTNQMIHRLESEGLVQYTPYKGVELTDAGKTHAKQILRRRRLWEVFLIDKLQLSSVEADEVACRLEHAIPDNIAELLSGYLNDPKSTPAGKNIPEPDKPFTHRHESELSSFDVGIVGEISSVQLEPSQIKFLRKRGVLPGEKVRLLARDESACLIQTAMGTIELSCDLAHSIFLANI